MKIVLLTIWHIGNYGAEMQTYATVKALQSLGHKVEVVDIRLTDASHISVKGRISKVISFFSPSERKINAFWKKFIPSTRRYRSLNQLQQYPPQADLYLVGSDQVWNPELTGDLSNVFFLDFGNNDVVRASYASSFGTDKWNYSQMKDEVQRLLSRLNHISCREQSGVELLKREFSLDATMVVDPTMLFASYKELIGKVEETNNLVYYPLGANEPITTYCQGLAKRLGLNAVNAQRTTKILRKIVWQRNSPQEWIRDIASARFVVTPSFHGCVFSILYQRQFAIVIQNTKRATRIVNLLESLGLKNRIYESYEALEAAKPWEQPIDYSSVMPKLEILRTASFNFLKSLSL